MKILFILILLFCSIKGVAQNNNKIDSTYYLVGTAQTPVISKMWTIDDDYTFKYYKLTCNCLPAKGNPFFSYNMKLGGEIISKRRMKSIKTVAPEDLILVAKKICSPTYNFRYAIFFIEPEGKRYIIHNMRLTNVDKEPGLTDYEIIPADSTKKKML